MLLVRVKTNDTPLALKSVVPVHTSYKLRFRSVTSEIARFDTATTIYSTENVNERYASTFTYL